MERTYLKLFRGLLSTSWLIKYDLSQVLTLVIHHHLAIILHVEYMPCGSVWGQSVGFDKHKVKIYSLTSACLGLDLRSTPVYHHLSYNLCFRAITGSYNMRTT